MGILTVPCSRFLEGFDLSDGESSLLVWTVDIADTFSLTRRLTARRRVLREQL